MGSFITALSLIWIKIPLLKYAVFKATLGLFSNGIILLKIFLQLLELFFIALLRFEIEISLECSAVLISLLVISILLVFDLKWLH